MQIFDVISCLSTSKLTLVDLWCRPVCREHTVGNGRWVTVANISTDNVLKWKLLSLNPGVQTTCVHMKVQTKGSDLRGYSLKVADFGLSQQMDSGKTHQTCKSYGTITHSAPEYMLCGKLSKPGDVFSYGMTMWELMAGLRPWKGCTQIEIITRWALLAHCQQVYRSAANDSTIFFENGWWL